MAKGYPIGAPLQTMLFAKSSITHRHDSSRQLWRNDRIAAILFTRCSQ
jgi:hypothetical protein